MKNPKTNESGKRDRSPNYPAIDLKAAIERASQFYTNERKQAAPCLVAVQHWGFSSLSGSARVVLSAMLKFGLMDEEGRGDDRLLKLSRLALNIILDERPDSPDRIAAIKEAALTPSIMMHLWKRYGHETPSEATMRTYLLRDLHFTPPAADDVIRIYRNTISFAGLSESDKISESEPEQSTAVSFFKQLAGVAPDEGKKKDDGVPARRSAMTGTITTDIKEDVFNLEEGEVILRWPKQLSEESVEEFESWLQLLIRRAKRSIQPRYADAAKAAREALADSRRDEDESDHD